MHSLQLLPYLVKQSESRSTCLFFVSVHSHAQTFQVDSGGSFEGGEAGDDVMPLYCA